jgi:uncharacterized membrane protein
MKALKQLGLLTLTTLLLDALWLTANHSYHVTVFAALQSQPLAIRWIPALLVYAVIIGAVWYFAVRPATSWTDAASSGALLGFSMYGVYDLTNYATLVKYPIRYALTDMAWGSALCAAAAAATYAII